MAEHSKRVYLEIQNDLADPTKPLPLLGTDFGWHNTSNGWMPIPTTRDPAPPEVLRTIFCSCMKGCGKACGCRKSGMVCNMACKHCETTECSNRSKITQNDDDDDENNLEELYNDLDDEETDEDEKTDNDEETDEDEETEEDKKTDEEDETSNDTDDEDDDYEMEKDDYDYEDDDVDE
jgi:hypothetical protein